MLECNQFVTLVIKMQSSIDIICRHNSGREARHEPETDRKIPSVLFGFDRDRRLDCRAERGQPGQPGGGHGPVHKPDPDPAAGAPRHLGSGSPLGASATAFGALAAIPVLGLLAFAWASRRRQRQAAARAVARERRRSSRSRQGTSLQGSLGEKYYRV